MAPGRAYVDDMRNVLGTLLCSSTVSIFEIDRLLSRDIVFLGSSGW
jgi:hypothetical protein